MIKVGLENSRMTCAIVTPTIAIINHVVMPIAG